MKKVSLHLFVAGVLACAALSGCNNDAFKYRPTLAARVDTITVFALNGTPAALPSGVNIGVFQTESDTTVVRPLAVPASTGTSFDFALDLNASGAPVAYPAGLVIRTAGSRRVGIQKVTTPFDQLTQAPNKGFAYDSVAVTLGAGDVLVVQAQRAFAGERCVERTTYGYDPVLYAKAQVLSIDPVERSLKLRIAINPNCGFRGLKPGSISGN